MFVLGFCIGIYAAPALADDTNNITITQVGGGDDLLLDIIQSGTDNKIFFSIGDGDDNDILIRQSGHNQEIGWVSWWGSGASWGGDVDYDDQTLRFQQNCTKSASVCNKNDIGFHVSYGTDNTIWWGQGYYFGSRTDTTWTYDGTEGGGHTANFDVHGSDNSLKGYQRNCSAGVCSGHTARIYLYGNGNDVFAIQDSDGAKNLEINIGTGYVPYHDNTIDTEQTGYAAHNAVITLTGTQPTTLDLLQTGGTAQGYTLSQHCVTSGGCTINVTQD